MSRVIDDRPLVETVVLGAAAGLVAAAAASLLQAGWRAARIPPTDTPAPTPPTEKLADEASVALGEGPLPPAQRVPAGRAVHFAMGAWMGAAYALMVRGRPHAGAASGLAFGVVAWVTLEEAGLSLFGLKPPPWRVRPAEHAFALSSHIVFGLTTSTAYNLLGRHTR